MGSKRDADPGPIVRVELESPVPISSQLYRQLVGAIAHRALPEGTILPSARQLAAELGVHYHTVNKAYGLLRRDGFAVLDTRKRVRTRRPESPSDGFLSEWTTRQRSLVDEALGSGLRPPELLARFRELVEAPSVRRTARPRAAR